MQYVVAHGGTGSKPAYKDGTDAAAEAGLRALRMGTPLDAVVATVAVLEDDERFNAGTGSALRFDGKTIEMDAAVMESDRGYGAVAGIQRVKNPSLVAKELVALPNNILCSDAARAFARKRGFPDHDPWTKKAEKQWKEMVARVLAGKAAVGESQWDLPTLERSWNYERPFEEVFGPAHSPKKPARAPNRSASPGDTVGAIVYDGNSFAAAGSTGGTITTLRGRVGDTPAIGAGIYASKRGAIAISGAGDEVLRMRLATKVERRLARSSAQEAADWAVQQLPEGMDVCILVGDKDGYGAAGNRSFAWSAKKDSKPKGQKRH